MHFTNILLTQYCQCSSVFLRQFLFFLTWTYTVRDHSHTSADVQSVRNNLISAGNSIPHQARENCFANGRSEFIYWNNCVKNKIWNIIALYECHMWTFHTVLWHDCTNYFFFWTMITIVCFLKTVLFDMVLFLQYSFLNTYFLKSVKCQYVRNVRLKYLLNQNIFLWFFSCCETQL